jgi:hypothetical protein
MVKHIRHRRGLEGIATARSGWTAAEFDTWQFSRRGVQAAARPGIQAWVAVFILRKTHWRA